MKQVLFLCIVLILYIQYRFMYRSQLDYKTFNKKLILSPKIHTYKDDDVKDNDLKDDDLKDDDLKKNLQDTIPVNVIFYTPLLPLEQLQTSIPKLIHQTYFNIDKIPQKVFLNIKYYAPLYKHCIYNDEEAYLFLKRFFHKNVCKTFKSLTLGAHKADLFRYAILYIYGGIYLDIKTELIEDIDQNDTFKDNCITTVLSSKYTEVYQGVIAAPPGQQIFIQLIDAILKSGSSPFYNRFCLDFYNYIAKDTKTSKIQSGFIQGQRHSYYLYKEVCKSTNRSLNLTCKDGLDRYGFCCTILDETKVRIKTRYSDYPWL
jgi:mannosyltransferase OCH1-like enzyme